MTRHQTFKYNGIDFDSKEEVDFQKWIEEGISAGLIDQYKYKPENWNLIDPVKIQIRKELKTKIKFVDKNLLRELTYEPDFKIIFNDIFWETFGDSVLFRAKKIDDIILNSQNVFIDVKGIYNQQDAHRRFSVIQKVVFDKLGIYVNKVVPQSFFKMTWVPEDVAYMANRKIRTRRKPFVKCKLLKEIL